MPIELPPHEEFKITGVNYHIASGVCGLVYRSPYIWAHFADRETIKIGPEDPLWDPLAALFLLCGEREGHDYLPHVMVPWEEWEALKEQANDEKIAAITRPA